MTARAAARAGTVGPDDYDTSVAAAWLHDIGYAPDPRDTGFRPVDGARYLRAYGWPHADLRSRRPPPRARVRPRCAATAPN